MSDENLDEKRIAELYDGFKGYSPVITLFDIETSPHLGWYWGKGYKTNIIEQEQDSAIMCFADKTLGKKTIHSTSMWNLDNYTPGRFEINDFEVTRRLHDLMVKTDIIIAQNGDRFDIKMANSRFIYYGLSPISHLKTVDTLKVAKKYFNMPFYSLDHLCRYLGIERKVDPGGVKTWLKCMDGDEKAQKTMDYYNRADVDRLEQVYLRMRGWMKEHPVLNLWTRRLNHCPVCMGTNYISKGEQGKSKVLATGVRWRFYCKDCTKDWYSDLHREDPKIAIYLK